MIMRQPAPVADRPLRMEDIPDPTAGPGQILVAVRACGICRTDLHVVEGELPMLRTPLVPGHQVVGRVAARGPDATRFREGDRVGIAWLRRTCGRCLYCATDRENLCERAEFTGWHADGGYAELAVVDEDYAYPIPSAFDDVEAAPLLCAGIIGYRALKLSAVRPGGRLGIYGFGSSAHVTIQLARWPPSSAPPGSATFTTRCRIAPRARSSSRRPASWCRWRCATWRGVARWRWPAST
jgi:propanol-preferring alcohol dehydrogenase